MNKTAFLLLTMLFFFNFSLRTQAEPFLFVNFDPFQKLTANEQKLYIRSLTEMILQLDQDLQNEFTNVPRSSSSHKIFQILIQQALAQTVTPSRQFSSDPREESAKIGKMMDFINGQIRSVQDFPSNKATKQRLEDDYFETLKRLYTLSEKKLDSESAQFSKRNVETMKNFWPTLVQINPELSKFKPNTFKRLDLTTTNINNQRGKEQKQVSTSPSTTTKLKIESEPSTELRCLYAGFIIKKTTCTPHKVLPNDFSLDPLANENFECATSKEILCNPILFGTTENNKPYCTTRSSTATKSCQDISNNTDNLKRILSLWKNPKNKKTINQFQKDLQTLCQDESRNSDVKSTCKVAVKQFNEKIKSELPTPGSVNQNQPGKNNTNR